MKMYFLVVKNNLINKLKTPKIISKINWKLLIPDDKNANAKNGINSSSITVYHPLLTNFFFIKLAYNIISLGTNWVPVWAN